MNEQPAKKMGARIAMLLTLAIIYSYVVAIRENRDSESRNFDP
jgi:hypothetical protein